MRSEILIEAEQFALERLKSDNPNHLVYHSVAHTQDVVASALEIANEQNLDESNKEILELAAWFHDLGYAEGKEDHEMRSAVKARAFLEQANYPEDKIQEIEKCILATTMPQNPTTELGQILCDADLLHLGSDDYLSKAETLREEMSVVMNCEISDEQWMEMNSDFLGNHCFFTNYARNSYGDKVKANLKKVNQKLSLWRRAKK